MRTEHNVRMSAFRGKHKTRQLLISLTAAAAATLLVLSATSCARTGPVLEGIGTTAPPDSPGPFVPCSMTINEFGPELQPLLVLFLPRSNEDERCVETLGAGRPLALLYHAKGAGNTVTDYNDLGMHLASHGIVVASLPHSIGVAEAIELLDEMGVDPSPEIALIGHSAGGDLMVTRRGEVASSGGELKAIVLMAPRVSTDIFFDYSLSGAESFLGLHWTWDSDHSTYGAPGQGPRRSVFRIYDRAGLDFNDPFKAGLWKHFAFFDYHGGHYQQHRIGLIAYVTAVLRRQFFDDSGQDSFLEGLSPIPGLAAGERPIAQQHHRKERLQIATFEEGSPLNPPIFDGVFDEGLSFTEGAEIVPAWTDPFSPHDLGVVRFNFVSEPGVERRRSLLFLRTCGARHRIS